MTDQQQYLKTQISLATRTESVIPSVTVNRDQFEWTLEVAIHAGNLLDQLKKSIFYGKPLDSGKVQYHVDVLQGLLARDDIHQFFNDEAAKDDVNVDSRLLHTALGVTTEGTEMLEALLKSYHTNQPTDLTNFREELFDTLWYVLIGHDALNVDVDGTLTMGFDKLRARYPNKFESTQAINRDVESERVILDRFAPDSGGSQNGTNG